MPMPMRSAALPAAVRSTLSSSIISIMSSAARTAAPAWSSSGSGAPKIAISPSPIIWLTTPPWPLIASNISVYQVFSSSIDSSGGCDSTSEVKPRMSANITRAAHTPAAEREARLLHVLRDLRGREAPHQLLLLVAQALLLEARVDAGLQQHRIHRLGQVVVGAELDAARDVGDAFERRGDEDRQVAQARIADQLLEDLEAGHLRHLHVEQQQVERLGAQHLERDPAVLGAVDLVALQLEAALQQQPVDLVVVGDQQSRAALSHRQRLFSAAAARRVFGFEGVERRSVGRHRAELELARQRPEPQRAEGVAVRLQRVRGAPEALGRAGGVRGAQLGRACPALPRGRCRPAR